MTANELSAGRLDVYTEASEFIDVNTAKIAIMEAISGRLESDGKTVAPLEIERHKAHDAATGKDWFIGPSVESLKCSAPLVPEETLMTKEIMPNGDIIKGYAYVPRMVYSIYNTITGRCETKLDSEAIKVLLNGCDALIDALEGNGYDPGDFYYEQEMPSFQFDTSKKDGDLPPTRLYLQRADTRGMQIVADLIDAGARPDYGKIWVPYASENEQRYRHDVVILGFSSFGDLKKAVGLLREGFASGKIDRKGAKEEVISGLEITGVPGAYIGQTSDRGYSFNGDMADYFEEAIKVSILEGGRQPQTGETITDEWLESTAQRMRDTLKRIMKRDGRTVHHALIDSDRTDDLLELARVVDC